MKKQLSYSVLSLAFAMFSISANAQSVSSDIVKASPSTFVNSNETLKTEAVKAPSAVEIKFENKFPGASEVKWTNIENGLLVTCLFAGQKTSVAYSNNGKMNYSIINLSEANIPANLKQVIKNEYSDFVVIKAIEINNSGSISNQVVLKSDKKFVTLKSNGEELDVETIDNATAVK